MYTVVFLDGTNERMKMNDSGAHCTDLRKNLDFVSSSMVILTVRVDSGYTEHSR